MSLFAGPPRFGDYLDIVSANVALDRKHAEMARHAESLLAMNRKMIAAARYAADQHRALVDRVIAETKDKGVDDSRISLEYRPNGRTRILVDTWPVAEVWVDYLSAEDRDRERVERPPVL